MSYAIVAPKTLKPQLTYAAPIPAMPLTPLVSPQSVGQVLPAQDDSGKKLLIAVVVILLIVAALAWLGKQERPVKRNPVKQLSTADLAQMLYDRLQRRGGANKSTLQALSAYANQKP